MKDLSVFISCGLYEGLLALICLVLYRKYKVKAEIIRKIIHTFTSLCTYPVMYLFSSLWWRLSGPAVFVVLNFLLSFGGMGKFLGMTERKRFMGLVYYPFSLLLLVLFAEWGYLSREAVLLGMLAMGFGDGLAAVVGTTWGRHPYRIYGKYSKSIEGTVAMVIIVTALGFSVTPAGFPVALAVGVLSALLENFTPFGLDNITVPVLTAFALEVLCAL